MKRGTGRLGTLLLAAARSATLLLLVSATAAAQGGPGIAVTRNENVEVKLGGRIHRMIQLVFDGASTTRLFTDAEQGPTVLRSDVTAKPSDALSIGATLEIALQQNRPFRVSQDNTETGLDVSGRLVEIFMQTEAGKFSLGRGFASSWYSPEIDLSMTQFAALLPVGMLSPGLKFVDRSTDSLSSIQVLTHFIDVERLLIQDRLRYDSPRLAGLQLSGSVASDERWDATLRTRHTPEGFTVAGGTSYAQKPFEGIEWRWDIGASVRHEASGLSLTGGYLVERMDRGVNAASWVAKIGWLADLVPLGQTAFAADFFQGNDVQLNGDESTSFGIFAMQKWPTYGLDLYVGVRRYDADRPDIDLEPLLVIPFGVAFSF